MFFGLWPSSQSYARVDFDQPFSLKEFKGKWEQRLVFRQEEESQIHEKVKSALAAHSLYISWHTSRFMLTDLLAFLSSIKGHHHQINATKLKALIDDIQMRKRFIGFIGPHSETDLQSMAESNKTWLANSSETQIELSSLHGGLFVRFSIVLLAFPKNYIFVVCSILLGRAET